MDMPVNDTKERQQPPRPTVSVGLEAKAGQHEFRITDAQREAIFACDLAWSHSDESSNDFRSDSYTKPTLRMLEAIISTSLGDGDTDEDPATHALQDYIAGLVGHEASLLVASGTMGNQVAHQAALPVPPYSILADHRAHFHTFESGGASLLCGALIRQAVPSNGHHLTLADIKRESTLGETVYEVPTRVISLENTLRGTIMPLSDVRAISQWARSQSPPIHMHLDGTRLWEAVAAGAFTLSEIGPCFDSIQLCFTKGIGAPLGSIVTGSSVYIKRAKWCRKFLGGGMRATGLIAAPARAAVDDVFFGGKVKAAQDQAKYASDFWEQLGGKLSMPTETNIVWLDLEGSGLKYEDFYPVALKFNLKFRDLQLGRLVFHYQISDSALARLCDFFKAVLQ
ncbi:putative low-specificity L-threonine aldolase [Microsporum canis]|uniref:L-allo-threonine aldolase n=1 Tax=Arthroderma otae (strain ATCC MYA-4605 / CBS 113480) TaxID=554155 RepID=C5FYK1_ARTOC|nr:l-allo-threonine aldolase [Microsporum canis CBS 113480]EEQ34599.1 l-allo-threonine aldolase [Microsporum canis CBS 113480]